MKFIRIAGSLSKIRISLSVTATTFTGFFVFSGNLSPSLLPLLGGIFLLASGSSALNHYQERKTDSLMERTRSRPIPSGLVSPGSVLLFTLLALVTGSLLLLYAFPAIILLLGLFNFVWYNAVYTPLKRVTAFAVIPGSVTGGVPPLIGWLAAGGHWMDPEIVVIVLFFIVGQIPHFWLLLLRYGREYEMAGLPSLTTLFSPGQINRISYTWIVATAAASALLPAYGLISRTPLLIVYIVATAILLMFSAYHNLNRHTESQNSGSFFALNIFYLLIMILIITDAAVTTPSQAVTSAAGWLFFLPFR
jgi:heme o synthase